MKTSRKIILSLLLLTVALCALVGCNFTSTVYFDPNYEGAQNYEVSYQLGQRPQAPIVNRTNYKFEGWYVDKTCSIPYTDLTQLYNGAVFYAKWTALPVSMEVDSDNIGTLYVGDTLNKDDFKVYVTYADGKTRNVTDFNVDLSGVSATDGDRTVEFSYTENDVTVTKNVVLQVSKTVPSEISAVYNGGKVVVGKEVDKTQIAVEITYNNGVKQTVTDFTLPQPTCETEGEQNITVSYTENGVTLTDTVTVTFVEYKLVSISAQYTGSSVPVGLGLEKSDFTVVATYSDDSSKAVTDFTVADFTAERVGDSDVTVSYTEGGVTKSTTVVVSVIDAVIVDLTVTAGSKEVYVGDTFIAEMVNVTAVFSDGATEQATDFTVAGFDSSTAGSTEITVTYCGETATVTLTVIEVQLIGISATQDGTVFPVGSTFRPTTLTVLALYNNGTSEVLKSSGTNRYSRSGFSTQEAGIITGTVSYKGFTAEVQFTVVQSELSAITARYIGETLYDGDELKLSDVEVLGQYDTISHPLKDFVVEGYKADVVGEQTLTVIYTNDDNSTLSTTLTVTVVRRTLVSISATCNDTVTVGAQLDSSLLQVVATFNNGTTAVVTDFGKGDLDTSTSGTKSVQVSYTWYGTTVSCNVQVVVVNSTSAFGNNLSIHFLELGNQYTGDSVYIKAGETDILIDAGSRQSSASTIGAYVDDFCTDGTLEYVIATHAHQDHIAGFVGSSQGGIFDMFECDTIIEFCRTNQKLTTSSGNPTLYSQYLEARDKEVASGAKCYTALQCVNEENGAKRVYNLTEDGSIKMEILYQKYYSEETSNENDYSVCVMLSQITPQGYNHYLLTGDLEAAGEASLVENNDLPQMVLYKGGHHGSYTAASETLLRKIAPEYVCICCCAGSVEYTQNMANTFPAQAFIDRIAPYTDKVYVTTLGIVKENGVNKNGSIKWANEGYESMNGNIQFICENGAISLKFSNNDLKLKDTQWFKTYRTCPEAWK